MKDFSAFLDVRKYKNWAHKISSWKYLSEDLSFQSPSPYHRNPRPSPTSPPPPAQSASFLLSTLNSFQGMLKVGSCRSTWFNPCRGRWQVPVCSWQGSLLVINPTVLWKALPDHFVPQCPENSFRDLAKILLMGHSMCCYWTRSINSNQRALDHLPLLLCYGPGKIPSCFIFYI